MTPDPITPPAERAVEIRAKEIYETWVDHPCYVPWSTGGNSEMQDNARFMAAKELGSGFAPYQIRGSDTTQPSETQTPRTDAFIEYSVRTDHNWRTFARTLETDLQHLARVAEQAASQCALVLSGESMSKFELTQALESTRDLLSEIKRIKTKI